MYADWVGELGEVLLSRQGLRVLTGSVYWSLDCATESSALLAPEVCFQAESTRA